MLYNELGFDVTAQPTDTSRRQLQLVCLLIYEFSTNALSEYHRPDSQAC